MSAVNGMTRGGASVDLFDRPPPPVLKVGLDLDGCFYDFGAAYYQGCVRAGLIDGEGRFVAPTRWEFYEDEPFGQDLETFVASANHLADLGLLWAGPMHQGGGGAWIALHEQGHELHVITDRQFGSHPIASQVGTYAWLNSHGLPYDSVTFSADKTCVPVDIMLEDKIENFRALQECGVEVWLLDRPWNRHVDVGGWRLYKHDEFVTRVKAMQMRRETVQAVFG